MCRNVSYSMTGKNQKSNHIGKKVLNKNLSMKFEVVLEGNEQ